MTKISPEIENCINLEQIVSVVNSYDGSEVGSKLAGDYAYSAAKDAGYGFSEENLEWHLEILNDAGAEFEYADALKEAKRLSEDD